MVFFLHWRNQLQRCAVQHFLTNILGVYAYTDMNKDGQLTKGEFLAGMAALR